MSSTSPDADPTASAGLPPSPLRPEDTLDGVLGVERIAVSAEEVVSRTVIDDRHRQPFGLVHGGFYALVAESSASIGGTVAVAGGREIAVGLSNATSFLRPFVGEGVLISTARLVHRGRTTQLWDVDHASEDGRLYATSRVTLAIRPIPG